MGRRLCLRMIAVRLQVVAEVLALVGHELRERTEGPPSTEQGVRGNAQVLAQVRHLRVPEACFECRFECSSAHVWTWLACSATSALTSRARIANVPRMLAPFLQ